MYGNNYGYNPYYQQPRYNTMPQQPIEQPLQTNLMSTRNILNGKQVDSIDVVKAMDIPLDGSISYFPLADGTAIVTKQLQTDGTSKTVIFKPVDEEKTTVTITRNSTTLATIKMNDWKNSQNISLKDYFDTTMISFSDSFI